MSAYAADDDGGGTVPVTRDEVPANASTTSARGESVTDPLNGRPSTDGPASDETTEAQQRLFVKVFGISEDELRRNGLDPGDYARNHVHEVLEDKENRARLLSVSAQLRREMIDRGLLGYKFIFAGFAALMVAALDKASGVHDVALAIAGILAIIGMAIAGSAIKIQLRYNRACREEGISPTAYLRRPWF